MSRSVAYPNFSQNNFSSAPERDFMMSSEGRSTGHSVLTAVNAIRLYNQDMYNFLMNADLGPLVDADAEIRTTSSDARLWNIENLVQFEGRLQDDLMCLQADTIYMGQKVVVAQKSTLGQLLAVNCFWELYHSSQGGVRWDTNKIPLSQSI